MSEDMGGAVDTVVDTQSEAADVVDPTAIEVAEDIANDGDGQEAENATGEESEGDKADEGKETESVVYTSEDFKLPEGMEVDQGMMDSFLEVANNGELSGKDRDQAMIDLYAQKVQQATEANLNAWETQRAEWRAEVEADKEIGGKHLDETKADCLAAMSEYGSAEFKQFCEKFGFLDNPHTVAFLRNVGKTTREGQHVRGQQSSGPKDIASSWYKSDQDSE